MSPLCLGAIILFNVIVGGALLIAGIKKFKGERVVDGKWYSREEYEQMEKAGYKEIAGKWVKVDKEKEEDTSGSSAS